jgi:hypothetical protein
MRTRKKRSTTVRTTVVAMASHRSMPTHRLPSSVTMGR